MLCTVVATLVLLVAACNAGNPPPAPVPILAAAYRRAGHCDELRDASAQAACGRHMQHALASEGDLRAASTRDPDSTAAVSLMSAPAHSLGHHSGRHARLVSPDMCGGVHRAHRGRASNNAAYDDYKAAAALYPSGGPSEHEQGDGADGDDGTTFDALAPPEYASARSASLASPYESGDGGAYYKRSDSKASSSEQALAQSHGHRRHHRMARPPSHAVPSVLRTTLLNGVFVTYTSNDTFAMNGTTLVTNASSLVGGVLQYNRFDPASDADRTHGDFSWLLGKEWGLVPASASLTTDATGKPTSFSITGTWGQGMNYVADTHFQGSNPYTEDACITVPDIDSCTVFISKPEQGVFAQYSGQLAASGSRPSLAAGPMTIEAFNAAAIRHPGSPLASRGELTFMCNNLQCSSLNAADCLIMRQAVVILFVQAPACSPALEATVRDNIFNFLVAQPGVVASSLVVDVLCTVAPASTRLAPGAGRAPVGANQALILQVTASYTGTATGTDTLVQNITADPTCGTGLCNEGVNVTGSIATTTDPTSPASLVDFKRVVNPELAPLVVQVTYAQPSSLVAGIPVGLAASPAGLVSCAPNPAKTDDAGVATFGCQVAAAGSVNLTATAPNPLNASAPLQALLQDVQLQGGASLSLARSGDAASGALAAGTPFNLTATFTYPGGQVAGMAVSLLLDPESAGNCTALSAATDAAGQMEFTCTANQTVNATATAANPVAGAGDVQSAPVTVEMVCVGTCPAGQSFVNKVPCTTVPEGGCCRATSFNASYTLGTINNQNGWTTQDNFTNCQSVASWDQSITQDGADTVWQLSNAVTNGGFKAQPFTYTSCLTAGEPGASLWNDYGSNGCSPLNPPAFGTNATSPTFYYSLKFRSATGSNQTGLEVALAANAKQSTWRMSFLSIADTDAGAGYNLVYQDSGVNGTFDTPKVVIASGVSYTAWHTIVCTIEFVPGVTLTGANVTGNDILKIFLDGQLIHTGTTWETYYYSASEAQFVPGQPRLQAVDSLLFRVASPAVPALSGKGLFFQDVTVGNVP